MSDNENEQYLDEEYHFAEEPDLGMESPPQEKKYESQASASATQKQMPFNMDRVKAFFNETSPARNAVVVIGILVILFIIYKIISGLFFNNAESTLPQTPIKQKPVQITQKPMTQQPRMVSTSAPTINQRAVLNDMNTLKARMSSMEQNQTNLQEQVASINNQLSSISNNLNALTTKLTQMSQQLGQLNVEVQEQAQHMTLMKARLEPKPKVRKIYPRGPSVVYYLKAVIPGRAWLVANNGNTLTVRVGSPIPHYGVVRFIDAIQGRVLTSSGQLIRFSQDDS